MADLDDRLDAVLDRWVVPPLEGDLTGRVMARAAAEERALDELLASADPQPTLGRDLVAPVLARVDREEAALDRLLDAADSAPRLEGDLSVPVLRTLRRRRLGARIGALAASLAAAAAVAIVYFVLQGPAAPEQSPVSRAPQDQSATVAESLPETSQLSKEDRLVVMNMGLVADWAVLEHWDTIRAMEQLEAEAQAGRSL